MAVDFPSDLVLDVARAADPASARGLEAQLNAGVSAGATSPVGDTAQFGNHFSRAVESKDNKEIGKEFEAMLLSSMIEDMMTETGESFFGKGFAGDVWKSMMAEQIAGQIVEGSDFGFAASISDYVVRQGDVVEPLRGVNDPQATSEEMRTQDAARRGMQEISRDFIRDMMSPVGNGTKS